MLPGRYTVRVKFEGQEASAAVEVREDPRFQVPMAVQRERLDFIMTVGQRQEVAAEAVNRLRDAKRAVDRAVEQVEANRGATDSTAKALPWCITLDNSKGISRLRFWAKNSRVNGINDLPVFMHQGISPAARPCQSAGRGHGPVPARS